MAINAPALRSQLGIPNRGLELGSRFDLPRLKGYSAELFRLEIEKMMELEQIPEEERDFFYTVCNGNSGLRYKRDVIGVASQSHLYEDQYINIHVLSLSRNGIYQSLPEALFHPLTLGNVYSSVDDVISEIQHNTLTTAQCKQFFALFDTMLFDFKTQILDRQITWPYKTGDETIVKLLQVFFGHDLEHTYRQAMILLTTIMFHEDIKCSLALQAQLLGLLLLKRVEVKEIPYYYKNPPFATLGQGILGINIGLSGRSRAELDDLLVEVWLENAEQVDEYMADKKKQNYIKGIMKHFNMSSRSVHVRFQINDDGTERILGKDGYLGINIRL